MEDDGKLVERPATCGGALLQLLGRYVLVGLSDSICAFLLHFAVCSISVAVLEFDDVGVACGFSPWL